MTAYPHSMDTLPTLPHDVSPGSAALWAANILLGATLERGWPADQIGDLLLTLTARVASRHHADHELHAILQHKLDAARSSGKQ